MTTESGGLATDQKSAAERIEEARRLHETIQKTLKDVLDTIKSGDLQDVGLVPKQVTRLTDAIGDLRKREAEFNDKFGSGFADDEVDFDDLRREIGCRIRRIRRCCKS